MKRNLVLDAIEDEGLVTVKPLPQVVFIQKYGRVCPSHGEGGMRVAIDVMVCPWLHFLSERVAAKRSVANKGRLRSASWTGVTTQVRRGWGGRWSGGAKLGVHCHHAMISHRELGSVHELGPTARIHSLDTCRVPKFGS